MCDTTKPVQVSLGIALRQVIDLNEPRQILEINAWFRMQHVYTNEIQEFNLENHVGNGALGKHDITDLNIDRNGVLDSSFPENGRNTNTMKDETILNSSELMQTLKRTLESVKAVEKYINDRKRHEETVEEWQLLAQVLDRVFLLMFILISVISTMSILLKSSQT
ncbi:hypothetical protein KUTeg_018410 [Tegillarca granosa]|uniref:Neurotransmitter-gated ion-channel transmembrane domain-containing protein n=1 Tax=Tegillarca granosa TaxID=220873 RepID=A0ABQ9EML9_TEGGR|nr:hypothetical protein KUTeg_018410 [Tegillarca granosa]